MNFNHAPNNDAQRDHSYVHNMRATSGSDAAYSDAPSETSASDNVLDEAARIVYHEWTTDGGKHAPMYLWTDLIESASRAEEDLLLNVPVASAEDVRTMVMMPMSWYYESLEALSCQLDVDADDPMEVMPTFELDSQALGGVETVMGNALASNRWEDAVEAMTAAISMAVRFTGTVADRNDEACDYVRLQIHRLRLYTDMVARNADFGTSMKVLTIIGDLACSRVMLMYPDFMVQLLACSLSFARWDDTRMLAFDLIRRAVDHMEHHAVACGALHEDGPVAYDGTGAFRDGICWTPELVDDILEFVNTQAVERGYSEHKRREMEAIAVCWARFEERLAYLRHDLLVLSGDERGAAALIA